MLEEKIETGAVFSPSLSLAQIVNINLPFVFSSSSPSFPDLRVLLKGKVFDSRNAKRTNNLPVDVEAFSPTVRDYGRCSARL